MSLKVVTSPSAGDAQHAGGADWNRVANLLNAGNNILNVDINSDWKFRDARCKLVNGSNIASLRTSLLNRSLSIQLPVPTADTNDDTFVLNNAPAILTNKTIDAGSNTMTGFVQLPSARKWGAIMIGPDVGAEGLGLLSGYSSIPTTPTFQVGSTNGLNWRYNTGSSANTATGIRMSTTAGTQFACRSFHSLLRVKTRVLTGPTNTRQYIGFSNNLTPPNTDTPLANADSGIFVGWRTSDAGTAIQVIRNSGAGTAGVTSTGVAPTTGVTQFEISFTETNPITGAATPGVFVRILSARGSTVTYQQFFENNIPAVDTMMSPFVIHSTTGTNANYDVYFVEESQDM